MRQHDCDDASFTKRDEDADIGMAAIDRAIVAVSALLLLAAVVAFWAADQALSAPLPSSPPSAATRLGLRPALAEARR